MWFTTISYTEADNKDQFRQILNLTLFRITGLESLIIGLPSD